jgi:hypothetical protein
MVSVDGNMIPVNKSALGRGGGGLGMPHFEQGGDGVVDGLLGGVHAAVAQLAVPPVDPTEEIGDRGRSLVPLRG